MSDNNNNKSDKNDIFSIQVILNYVPKVLYEFKNYKLVISMCTLANKEKYLHDNLLCEIIRNHLDVLIYMYLFTTKSINKYISTKISTDKTVRDLLLKEQQLSKNQNKQPFFRILLDIQ